MHRVAAVERAVSLAAIKVFTRQGFSSAYIQLCEVSVACVLCPFVGMCCPLSVVLGSVPYIDTGLVSFKTKY